MWLIKCLDIYSCTSPFIRGTKKCGIRVGIKVIISNTALVINDAFFVNGQHNLNLFFALSKNVLMIQLC